MGTYNIGLQNVGPLLAANGSVEEAAPVGGPFYCASRSQIIASAAISTMHLGGCFRFLTLT